MCLPRLDVMRVQIARRSTLNALVPVTLSDCRRPITGLTVRAQSSVRLLGRIAFPQWVRLSGHLPSAAIRHSLSNLGAPLASLELIARLRLDAMLFQPRENYSRSYADLSPDLHGGLGGVLAGQPLPAPELFRASGADSNAEPMQTTDNRFRRKPESICNLVAGKALYFVEKP